MDNLIANLRNSSYGCHIGPYFMGTLGYADDLCLLSPTIHGLQKMVDICTNYAQKHSILFNGAKSHLLRFCPRRQCSFCRTSKADVVIDGDIITPEDSTTHLGHTVRTDLQHDADGIYSKFYKQYNIFRTRFAGVPSLIKNQLFISYCSSFYGIQICDLRRTDRIQTAWRKCVRDVWKLPYRTHSCLLPALTDTLCCKHMLFKRFAKFAGNALQHFSHEIQFLFKSAATMRNTFARNVAYLKDETSIDIHLLKDQDPNYVTGCISRQCRQKCRGDNVLSNTIAELSSLRDGLKFTVLNNSEIIELLNDVCVS